jgi:3-hydroxyisobutyrate dehydrogenase-like beta-hydroxyacid dehydrogenase
MAGEIGIIGLGGMGGGIASRLLDQGHRVAVWNRTASAADALVARGARRAASPADAAAPDGTVITMIANDAALESVTGGEHGLEARLGHDGLHISMSTVSPALARSLAARHAARGAHFVAAPVFGRPDAAAAGKLWILASGAEPANAPARCWRRSARASSISARRRTRRRSARSPATS